MEGHLGTITGRKGNRQLRHDLSGCEPAVLQNTRGNTSGINRHEVHGYNSTADTGFRPEECQTSSKRFNRLILFAKKVRDAGWSASERFVAGFWSLFAARPVFIFRQPDNATVGYTENGTSYYPVLALKPEVGSNYKEDMEGMACNIDIAKFNGSPYCIRYKRVK